MATSSALWDYRDRFSDRFAKTYFRRFGSGVVSSIGIGTYLGDPTDEDDEKYRSAIERAILSGSNVIDTAINYRCQRSERVIGSVLKLVDVTRESVLVATKGGFVPFNRSPPANPGEYIHREYIDTGLVDPNDLVMGSHCIAPDYIENQLDRSLENLGLDHIDLYYVHNPETQLREKSREKVYEQLEETFQRLEQQINRGRISGYGVATWEAFRVPQGHDQFLSLREITASARRAANAVGNDRTGLQAIQLPFNINMADGVMVEAHEGASGIESALHFARLAGLAVFTSASIHQGRLAVSIPEEVDDQLAGKTSAQRAINFARSAPGVTCALVGMKSVDHVKENVTAGRYEPLGANAFDQVFD